eukprot:3519433-Prymnesium_polylepis.1
MTEATMAGAGSGRGEASRTACLRLWRPQHLRGCFSQGMRGAGWMGWSRLYDVQSHRGGMVGTRSGHGRAYTRDIDAVSYRPGGVRGAAWEYVWST